jgi:hypothetical protein
VVMPTFPQSYRSRTRLIERALLYQFDARTTFAIGADGVHCTISLPVSNTRGLMRIIRVSPSFAELTVPLRFQSPNT